MTTSTTRAALACALLASTCLSAPAIAQTTDVPPPVRFQVDENSVDMARGTIAFASTDLSIGPNGSSGLTFRRGGHHSFNLGLFENGGIWTAHIGPRSYEFALSGSTYVSRDGSGATFVKTGTNAYLLTTAEGVKVVYDYTKKDSLDSASRKARGTSISYQTAYRRR